MRWQARQKSSSLISSPAIAANSFGLNFAAVKLPIPLKIDGKILLAFFGRFWDNIFKRV